MIPIAFHVSLILIITFAFNQLMIKSKIVKIPNVYFGVTFFILSIPLLLNNIHVVTLMMILLFTILYIELITIKLSTNKLLNIFNTGFILALMALLDLESSFFYLFIFLSLLFYKEFEAKTILIQIIGGLSIVPIYYCISELNLIPKEKIQQIPFNLEQAYYAYSNHKFLMASCFLIMILSIYELYLKYYKKTEYAKKAFSTLIIFIFVTTLHLAIFQKVKYIFCLIIPISIIMTNYLIYIKGGVFRTFLLGLLLVSYLLDLFYL
tara:strand:+ start:596 stop:1390 length:795 start_codon:yes stop_codon:yes gene_type:complete